jgi:hypothetical protein
MGVRPPSNDIGEEPDITEFGIAALDARIEEMDVSFPVTAAELRRQYGDVRVPVDPAGNEIQLGEVIAATDQTEFASETELQRALSPVFEQKRKAVSGGVVGWLRSLLPF